MIRFSLFSMLIFVANQALAQVPPPPELKSAEAPAAIPEDHKAVIESAEIVARVNNDAFFKLSNELKEAKLREIIALARKGEAEANAAACKSNPHTCARLGIVNNAVSENKEEDKGKSEQAAVLAAQSEAIAKSRMIANQEKNILEGIHLSGIEGNKAILRFEGRVVSLPVGGTHANVKLLSVDTNSATIKGMRSGLTRTIHVNEMHSFPTGQIRPVKKDQNGSLEN